MRVLIFFVLCLSYALAGPRVNLKQCADCTGYESCTAARDLLLKQDPANDAKVQAAFCGFDNQSNLPKVCCSELSNGKLSSTESASDSVEGHPNLRLLPEACGEIDGDKIIGGRTAGLYEYPWMVLLSYQRRNSLMFNCGGTLINERYVLTAAHCVVSQPLVGVRVGEHDLDTKTDCVGEPPRMLCETHIQDFRIAKMIPHPNFQSNKLYDIALLRLKKPVNFSYKNAGIVCLPVTRELQNRDIVGLDGVVAGWGITETGYTSSKLLAVEVPISTGESCSQLINRRGQTQSDENLKICAGRGGQDSCNGDSGGPLMLKGRFSRSQRYVEYGIVSTGPHECGSGILGTYTSVSKNMKWILDNIEP